MGHNNDAGDSISTQPPPGLNRGEASHAPYAKRRVIWITGLSGAGKSTLAAEVAQRLRAEGQAVVVLDGDELREVLKNRIRLSIDDNLETMIVSHVDRSGFGSTIRLSQDAEEQDAKEVAFEYSSLLLVIPKDDDIVVVGIIALVRGDEPIRSVDSDFLIEVACGIYDAGDVQTVYYGAPPVSREQKK